MEHIISWRPLVSWTLLELHARMKDVLVITNMENPQDRTYQAFRIMFSIFKLPKEVDLLDEPLWCSGARLFEFHICIC